MNHSFLGTGWAFPPEFSDDQQEAVLSSDEQNIQHSLCAILGTIPGERIMDVHFGCNLRDKLFEAVNNTQQTQIKDIVRNALNNYEPRIRVDEVMLNVENLIDGLLQIVIEYTILSTNQRDNMVYPFYKTEGTELS